MLLNFIRKIPGPNDVAQPVVVPPQQTASVPQAAGASPAAPGGGGLAAVTSAIYGQETNYGRNAHTSSAGAEGPMQIEPATFAQYALPGENIHNADDNRAVGNRIIGDYYNKFGGDPARVATAYYSGPHNVAPADSATPWVHDISQDRHGNPIKPVSSYVSDVLGRINSSSSNTPAPGTPSTRLGTVSGDQAQVSGN